MTVEPENYTDSDSYIEKRNALLKNIDPLTIHKAWFTLAHLLLADDDVVADMGCGDGDMTFAMAVLEPTVRFIGIDKNKRLINRAKTQYNLPNLEYKSGDISQQVCEPDSLNAIVNSYILHEVYSGSQYNETIVSDTLEQHFKMLKRDGLMYIRDYARPPPEEFVLIEIPDKPSTGKEISQLSDGDLLMWYSEHARPRHDPGMGGFFLEEVPARFPKTRLFRLPYKWAYEFLMRKDNRAHWDKELPVEYTFFTPRDFRKDLRKLGARVQYAGPHWDEDYIEEHFEGKFRLFDDNDNALGYPQTSYIIVARKMNDRKSLHIHERRPSHTEESALKITAMRDAQTGEITDIVSRSEPIDEIIPYRINEQGRLKIYLHDGIVRSITNSVPRNGVSIDDRRWSGHMVESISVPNNVFATLEDITPKSSALFARDYLGLKPNNNALLEKGPEYYPSPDYIDDKINTYYLNVQHNKNRISPKSILDESIRFQAKGKIREFDAQQVLGAITVGFIPSARLELQLLALFNNLNIKAENWTSKQVSFTAGKIKQKTNLTDILHNYQLNKNKFKNVKGNAGQLRSVHSTFVEEGRAKGSVTGLSSEDVDFVVHNEQTLNTAVVLPLTKGLKNDVHAGFQMKQLPIPQRHTGNANTIAAPSFNLPREISNITLAKKYIAEQYGVLPEMVLKMGESYFQHIGMTQHRIHPFAVIVPPSLPKNPDTHFLPFYQFMLLRKSLSKDCHFMITLARAYQYFHEEIRRDFDLRVSAIVKEQFNEARPEWSLPLNFAPSPLPKKAKKESIQNLNKTQPDLKKPAPSLKALKATSIALPDKHKPDPSLSITASFEEELQAAIRTINSSPKPEQEPSPEKW